MRPRVDSTVFSWEALGWKDGGWFTHSPFTIPNATADPHAMNRITGDGRYARPTVTNSWTAVQTTTRTATEILANDANLASVGAVKELTANSSVYTVVQQSTFNFGNLMGIGEVWELYGTTFSQSSSNITIAGCTGHEESRMSLESNPDWGDFSNSFINNNSLLIGLDSTNRFPFTLRITKTGTSAFSFVYALMKTKQGGVIKMDGSMVTTSTSLTTTWLADNTFKFRRVL